jgi:hypothetical protein
VPIIIAGNRFLKDHQFFPNISLNILKQLKMTHFKPFQEHSFRTQKSQTGPNRVNALDITKQAEPMSFYTKNCFTDNAA